LFSLFNETKSQGPITNSTRSFFTRKTIQRTYNFLVRFDLSDNLQDRYELFEYHAVSVELPNYDFKKEEYRIGPFVKNFPVLDHNGFEFTIKFEEDDIGTISNFIDRMTRRNIKPDGYYNTLYNTVLNNIVVEVTRNDGVRVCSYIFKNCFMLKASTATYSYEASEKISYDITFNADHILKDYGKAHNVPDYTPSIIQEAEQGNINTELQ